MGTISHFGTGSVATGSTSVAPSPVASVAAGHRSILTVATKPSTATISTPANWTKIGETTGGTGTTGIDTGPTKIAMFYRDGAFSGTQSVTITSGNTSWGVISTYEDSAGDIWWYPNFTTGDDTTDSSSAYSATGAATLDWKTSDVIVVGICIPTDALTDATAQSLTATGITGGTATSRAVADSNTGQDIGGNVFEVIGATGTASAAPSISATFTDSTNTYGPCMVVRLRCSSAVQDNFNRSDANPAGNPWATMTSKGAFKILSNAAGVNSLSSDSACRYMSTFPNDQYSQAKLTVTGTGGAAGPGVCVRASSSADTLYVAHVSKAASNNVNIAKFVAHTYTSIANRTTTWVDGDVLRLEAVGTTLRVYKNGVQLGADITDSSIASGAAGMSYSSTVTAATWDDWEGGAVTTDVNVSAECPQISVVSNDGDASVAPNANNASITVSANNDSPRISVNAGLASVAFAANDLSPSVSVSAGVATANFAANNSAPIVSPSGTDTVVSFAASDATATTGNFVDVFPDTPVVSVTLNDATKGVAVNAGVASVSFVANNVTANIVSTATFAALAFIANNNTPSVSANAGVASITLTANKPGSGRTPNAPTSAFAAGDVDEKISVNAEASSFTVVANDGIISTSTNTNAPAGNVVVTVAANSPGKSVSVNAGVATVSVSADSPATALKAAAEATTVTLTAQNAQSSVVAYAGVAAVSLTANNTTTKVGSASELPSVLWTSLNGAIPAQFLRPPDLIIKKLSNSTTVNDKSNSVICSAKTGVLTVTDLTNGLIIRKVDNTVTVNE